MVSRQQFNCGRCVKLVAFAGMIVVFACSSPTAVQATIVTITADPAGGLIRSNGVTETGGVTRLIGSSSTSNQGLSNIYFFELPALGTNEKVNDAALKFNFDSTQGSFSFNSDLYGLGFVNSPPSMDGSWFFEGPAMDTRTRASLGTGNSGMVSLIEDDVLTTGTPTGSRTVAETSALVDFLASLYEDGAQGGDFAVFHFVADEVVSGPTGAAGYRITHSDGDPSDLAELEVTLTLVPEPGSMFGWALLGTAVVHRGRRKKAHRRVRS